MRKNFLTLKDKLSKLNNVEIVKNENINSAEI